MTLDEAKTVFLNRGYVEVDNGTYYDPDKWREACVVISELLEQESFEDEYIKVPKKALKYRTAGMVAYNAEWLKNHFDMERSVICGAQQPCNDAISRHAVLDQTYLWSKDEFLRATNPFDYLRKRINSLPPVTPQPKTVHCKDCKYFEYDSVAKVDGIPLIVAHEICNKWGNGCKTSEDGWCFLAEQKESENERMVES